MRRFIILTSLALGLVGSLASLLPVIEPLREGQVSNRMRDLSQIKHAPNPGIEIVEPGPYEPWGGEFVLTFNNWDYKPERATNPVTQFANGFQELNTGHVHGWVFNEFGQQVRFYGAAGTTFDGIFYIKPDDFPPGQYIAYFQLQNHDHTPAIQENAPAFPSIQSVSFFVPGEPEVELQPVNAFENEGCKQ
jgi:hypothetical protein